MCFIAGYVLVKNMPSDANAAAPQLCRMHIGQGYRTFIQEAARSMQANRYIAIVVTN